MASESGRVAPDRVASGTLEYRLKNVTIKTFLHHPGVHHTKHGKINKLTYDKSPKMDRMILYSPRFLHAEILNESVTHTRSRSQPPPAFQSVRRSVSQSCLPHTHMDRAKLVAVIVEVRRSVPRGPRARARSIQKSLCDGAWLPPQTPPGTGAPEMIEVAE